MEISIGFENPSPATFPCKVRYNDANRHTCGTVATGRTIDIVLAPPETSAAGGVEDFDGAEWW